MGMIFVSLFNKWVRGNLYVKFYSYKEVWYGNIFLIEIIILN